MQIETHTHTYMHSQPSTNANCRKMLMPVIISEPPLSYLQQHSFRGHRAKKEKCSFLVVANWTDRQAASWLPIDLENTERILSISLHSLNGFFFFSLLRCISLLFFPFYVVAWHLCYSQTMFFWLHQTVTGIVCDAVRDEDQHMIERAMQ